MTLRDMVFCETHIIELSLGDCDDCRRATCHRCQVLVLDLELRLCVTCAMRRGGVRYRPNPAPVVRA